MTEIHKPLVVEPELDNADLNPYRVEIITADEDFQQGRMRIVPPFHAHDRFYEAISDDVGVDIKLLLETKESTSIEFFVRETEFQSMPNEERVKHTAMRLVEELGLAASQYLFIEHYRT